MLGRIFRGVRRCRFANERLNLGIRIPLAGAFLQYEIRPHAPAGEILDAFVIFGPVSVGVEMPRPVVADILQEFDQPECAFDVGRPESEILVVASRHLIVEIDVEQLAGLPGLGDGMQEVQPGHLLVRDFRIDADQLRMRERRDESEVGAGGGHVDVAARFIRLRFERKPIPVIAIDRVLAQVVHRVTQSFHRFVRTAAGIGLGPFTAAPQHEDAGAELGAQVHRAQRFLQRVGTYLWIVRCKRAITEHRVEKQVHRRHGHDDVVRLAGAFEFADDAIALGWRRVDRDEIVVVEIDAPGADFAEQRHCVVGRERRAHDIAEGVSPAIADGPQTKRELVLGTRRVGVCHHL